MIRQGRSHLLRRGVDAVVSGYALGIVLLFLLVSGWVWLTQGPAAPPKVGGRVGQAAEPVIGLTAPRRLYAVVVVVGHAHLQLFHIAAVGAAVARQPAVAADAAAAVVRKLVVVVR